MEPSAVHGASEHLRGVLLVATATVAWSLAGFFTRLIPLDAWTILVWRGAFGGVFIGLYVVWRYGRRTLAVTRAMGWPGCLITACSTLGMTSFIPALKLTSVAHVAIIFATSPFLAAGMARLWLGERSSGATLLASALSFLGVLLAVGGPQGRASLLGDLLAFVMTTAIATMTVAIRRYRDTALLPTACLSNLLGSLVSLGAAQPLAASSLDLVYLALFGFVQMTMGLTLFTIGSRLIPAAETALIGALETPLAPFWVWLAFGETVGSRTIAGGALVMAAVIGHVLLQSRRALASSGP
ncbi:MAG TPA: DMT family transporter [Dongiaceae bacterium]|nr:DMT family transporter [Dongiaceae bacterium]